MTLYLDEKTLRTDTPEQEKTKSGRADTGGGEKSRNYTFDPATPVESIG